ncbi:probable peptidoglycan muropeptide transporter SLC46 isoform X2 [Armigeres subalbatus]|uniref:probable peptidoglycan muropeptide transporter SLC46 isoform X2 n=1 Tax=Armigeres subalbatus TaxID=124917 RepID=UPI002ED276D7
MLTNRSWFLSVAFCNSPSVHSRPATMDETAFSSGSMYSSGEEEILASEGLRLSRSVRWREVSNRHVNFEPALFLFCFALGLSEIELTHQIIYQTCCVQGFQRSDCLLVGTDANLPGVQEIEAQVKPVAASVNTVIVVIKSVVPAFGALVMGAWSDRYGRKPVVVIAGCGLLLTYFALTGLSFLSSFIQVNPWYYVLAYIPFSLPGGMAVLGGTIYAFISDVSNEQNRTVKMGFMKGIIVAGGTLGSYSCRYILEWTNTTTVLVIATICILFGLLYIALLVEDSIIPSTDSELGSSLQALFSFGLLRELTEAIFRKRSRMVWQILLLIIGFGALMELAVDSNTISYNFANRHFEWNRNQFSHFQLSENALIVFANIVGIISLKRIFSWPDTLVALIAIISHIICSTICGFATVGWQFYAATGLTFLKGMEEVAVLSLSSYLLQSNDMAKFYALAMSINGLVPLASKSLFDYFYQSNPGLFYFVGAGIYVGGLVILM